MRTVALMLFFSLPVLGSAIQERDYGKLEPVNFMPWLE